MKEDSCLNVYIAEDESIMLMNFKMILQRLGYHVTGSTVKGDRTLDGILELRPNLLLLDTNMPGMDGITLFNQVSKVYETACIFITRHFIEAFVENVKEAGTLGYLIRSVDEEQLEASIEVTMARFEEQRILRRETEKLKSDLPDREYIERIKGILTDSFGLKKEETMAGLQKLNEDKNKKLVVIAKELIEKDRIILR